MVLGGPDPNQNTKNGMAANYFWKIAPLVVRFCQMGFLGITKRLINSCNTVFDNCILDID
jgi:hypothetical protein